MKTATKKAAQQAQAAPQQAVQLESSPLPKVKLRLGKVGTLQPFTLKHAVLQACFNCNQRPLIDPDTKMQAVSPVHGPLYVTQKKQVETELIKVVQQWVDNYGIEINGVDDNGLVKNTPNAVHALSDKNQPIERRLSQGLPTKTNGKAKRDSDGNFVLDNDGEPTFEVTWTYAHVDGQYYLTPMAIAQLEALNGIARTIIEAANGGAK